MAYGCELLISLLLDWFQLNSIAELNSASIKPTKQQFRNQTNSQASHHVVNKFAVDFIPALFDEVWLKTFNQSESN